jgi:hypothetical protein
MPETLDFGPPGEDTESVIRNLVFNLMDFFAIRSKKMMKCSYAAQFFLIHQGDKMHA